MRKCILAAPFLALAVAPVFAGEVEFDKVDTGAPAFDQAYTREGVADQGPYISAFGGFTTGAGGDVGPRVEGGSLGSETGFLFGARWGYAWQTPFLIRPSVEFEINYLNDDVNVKGTAVNRGNRSSVDFTSNLQSIAGFVNFVLALDLNAYREQVGDILAGIHPYIGAGIGAAYTTMSGSETKARYRGEDGSYSKTEKFSGGSKLDWAYQFFGGIEFELLEDMSIFGEYKYLALQGTGSELLRNYDRDVWVVGVKLQY